MVGQTLVTDEEGKAVLEDVEEGLYFIDPVNIHEYERMSPMLVSVPEWDGDTLNYDVVMYPKHRPFEKLIIKKIDRDSKDEILDSIEFAFIGIIHAIIINMIKPIFFTISPPLHKLLELK